MSGFTNIMLAQTSSTAGAGSGAQNASFSILMEGNIDFTLGKIGYNGDIARITPVTAGGGAFGTKPILYAENGSRVFISYAYQNAFPWFEILLVDYDTGADVQFDTWSFIEIDWVGGTAVLDTRDVGAGGTMTHVDSSLDAGDGQTKFRFYDTDTGGPLWDQPQDNGATWDIRFIV